MRAKWKDNFYYLGTVKAITNDNKMTVLFEDGSIGAVTRNNILPDVLEPGQVHVYYTPTAMEKLICQLTIPQC